MTLLYLSYNLADIKAWLDTCRVKGSQTIGTWGFSGEGSIGRRPGAVVILRSLKRPAPRALRTRHLRARGAGEKHEARDARHADGLDGTHSLD